MLLKQKEILYSNTLARTESVCIISDGLSLREDFCVAFHLPRLSLAVFFFFAFSPTGEPGPRLEFYLHENKLKDSFSYQ